MRAVVQSEKGGPEVLSVGEVPDPGPPGPGEVLLHVAATAVNRADLLQRQGFYPPPPGASDIIGMECSGTVAAVGDGVAGWSVGDEVCALLAGGGYAEQVVVPAGQLLPVPGGVGLVEAAALPEAACTVWSNVVDVAGLRSGEWLLIHGGASGIGTFATQLARHVVRAHVAVTAGSAEKLARCEELGAEVLISYKEQDFVAATKAATSGRGADVVLDVMGAAYLARNVEVLAVDGRIVVIGLQGGVQGELPVGLMLQKRATLFATTLRSRSVEDKARICAGVVADVWPAVADGRIRPIIDRVLPLDDVAEAHRVLAASEHVGKVVLRVS
ncbi:MAG TPA: NAD(P)H-quinone oxidoreductase [Mycobacteriales bacterium]|nr:NAD(P)H-quinone oxidoreductase [Mycobacteriales bacterium]